MATKQETAGTELDTEKVNLYTARVMACATGGPLCRNKRPGALLYRFRFLLPRVFSPWGVFCPYQSSCAPWSLRCGTKIGRYSQVFIDSRYNSSIAPLCGLLVSPRIAELIDMRYDSLFLSSARNPPKWFSPFLVSANVPSFLGSLLVLCRGESQ